MPSQAREFRLSPVSSLYLLWQVAEKLGFRINHEFFRSLLQPIMEAAMRLPQVTEVLLFDVHSRKNAQPRSGEPVETIARTVSFSSWKRALLEQTPSRVSLHHTFKQCLQPRQAICTPMHKRINAITRKIP